MHELAQGMPPAPSSQWDRAVQGMPLPSLITLFWREAWHC
jgi:hypothetical protein